MFFERAKTRDFQVSARGEDCQHRLMVRTAGIDVWRTDTKDSPEVAPSLLQWVLP